MTQQRKKLIEVALPLEAINIASAREKFIRHGHPSTLHLWWARRPLAACRAVIFASLVDDPGDPELTEGAAPPPAAYVEACKRLPLGKNAADHDTPRQRLFDFIERLVQWESTNDEQVLETARELIRLATDGNPPPLLDPFAGGGSIPLEAQRLGLEAHASDLNPVAVMINKALIEIPPKFANRPPVNPEDREKAGGGASWKGATGLAADVRYYGQWMRDRAWERIGHLYPECNGETVIAWLWARTVTCPNPACGAQMPLVSSFWLSRKRGKEVWIEPQIDRRTKAVSFEVRQGKGRPPSPPKVGRGARFRCLVCGATAPNEHLYSEGVADRMDATLMAIVTEGSNGRSYYAPDGKHLMASEAAKPDWSPHGELPQNPRWFSPPLYGMTEFSDLFTPRQLVALTTFSDLVEEARARIYDDAIAAGLPHDDVPLRDGGAGARAYAEAVQVYLALALSRVEMGLNSLARWNSVGEKVQHCFGRQALPMVWDYAEPNPFTESTGSWWSGFKYVADPLEMGGVYPYIQGQVRQRDASTIDVDSTRLISTDPPYYDNVGYADLADFFYVWLRPMLQTVYPLEFSTVLVPKGPELVATPYRFDGNKEAAEEHFEKGMFATLDRLRAQCSTSYPLTVYYAFKQTDIVSGEGTANTGWETMLTSLLDAGFVVSGTWPVRTEMRTRLVASGTNALASSIVLVCRPRSHNAPIISRRDFVNELRRELPPALREMQSGNIAPVDLAQASIGPGMAVYSRYSKVLEPDGSRLRVRTALQLINRVLDEYLAEQEGYLDEASRFTVAWFEQYGFNSGDFGTADVLARAKNTSVDALAHEGVLRSGAGKVRLYKWDELNEKWDPGDHPTIWEATHRLVQALNTGGEAEMAAVLAQLSPELAAEARQLAYRLYAICERKGWTEPARDYNALVVSWGASQEQARELREQYQQGTLPGIG